MTLTEKKELEVVPSLDHSLAHVRSLCPSRGVRAHWSGETGIAKSKKRQKRSAQVAFLCLFLSCTARRSPVRNKLFFVNGVVDGTFGERFLTITLRIFLCDVPCLFFGGLFVFSALPC